MSKKGKKFDGDKLDWSLLPLDATEQVIQVLEHGKEKYGRDNWKYLEDFQNRYVAASFRHLTALARGEEIDPDSGLHHGAHLACNALFLASGPETPPDPKAGKAKYGRRAWTDEEIKELTWHLQEALETDEELKFVYKRLAGKFHRTEKAVAVRAATIMKSPPFKEPEQGELDL